MTNIGLTIVQRALLSGEDLSAATINGDGDRNRRLGSLSQTGTCA